METHDAYTLDFLPAALNDMTEVVSSYVMLGSKQGANRIKSKMNKAINQIHSFPYSGVSVHDSKLSKLGFRMIVVEKYLMFYKVFEEEKKIIFYRVLNGRTNYRTLLYKLYKDE